MVKLLCLLLKHITTKGTIIYEHKGQLEKIKW
jgi:hypothetical protein